MNNGTLSADRILELQKQQFRHDRRNHCDIQSLHKGERLKHYGLHFCKYVGRLARGHEEFKSQDRTVIDTTLVCLSAANTLGLRLSEHILVNFQVSTQIDIVAPYADAAGRFADACEKFDHLEDFSAQARVANADIFKWIQFMAFRRPLDLTNELAKRRTELAARAFYAEE